MKPLPAATAVAQAGRRRVLAATLAGLCGAALGSPMRSGGGVPPEVAEELPGARLQGSGRLRFWFFDVYDIRLWVPASASPGALGTDWAAAPLALEIEYARSLVGRQVADRSLLEMRRQAEIPAAQGERWLARMNMLFPDVAEGDRLTGVQQPGAAARFFVNGVFKGEVRDAEFTRLFFGIWLSPRTSEPALREALLGTASTRS